MVYSLDGKMVRERLYSDFGFGRYTFSKVLNEEKRSRIFIFDKDIVELDGNLGIVSKIKAPIKPFYFANILDFNNDGILPKCSLFWKDEKLVLLNSSLKKIAEIHLKSNRMGK